MADDFDVYFAGVCLPGFARDDVAASIARTFKLSDEAAQTLMDGKPHRIKAGCDKPTALKYREVMAGIGGKVDIVRHGASPAAATDGSQPEGLRKDIKPLVSGPAQFTSKPTKTAHDPGAGKVERIDEAISWEPPEKPIEPAATELTVAPVGILLGDNSDATSQPAVSVPDLEVAAAGEVIPTLPQHKEALNPKTGHLRIAPLDVD